MTVKYEVINPENIAVYLDTHQEANEVKKLLIENDIAGFALVIDNYIAVNLEGRDLDTAINYLKDLLDIEEELSTYDITQEIINEFGNKPKSMKYFAKITLNDKTWVITYYQLWMAILWVVFVIGLIINFF